MDKTTVTTTSSGIGFSGLLTILFIALKLLNVISWPWIWVLSPLWISFTLVVLLLVLAIIIMALAQRW